eukprot:scaffold28612_cov63-Phaeocystis_antarctica.AAC.2
MVTTHLLPSDHRMPDHVVPSREGVCSRHWPTCTPSPASMRWPSDEIFASNSQSRSVYRLMLSSAQLMLTFWPMPGGPTSSASNRRACTIGAGSLIGRPLAAGRLFTVGAARLAGTSMENVAVAVSATSTPDRIASPQLAHTMRMSAPKRRT